MYANFLAGETKKWTRDSMMRFMLFYPVLFGLIGRYILPLITESAGFPLEPFADVALAFLTLMTPQIFGALIGFSILDDRDDHIFTSIRVTPLSIHWFLSFRLAMGFLLAFIGSVYVMWFSAIGGLPLNNILAIAFLAALGAPMVGLLINALARNKIEGFAVMKALGTILIFPLAGLFVFNWRELFFAVAPAFWPAKAISSVVRGEELLFLTYDQYYFVGLAYVVFLNILVYKIFLRRAKV